MQTITISFTKANIITSIESLLWKYGAAVETTENFKTVYNIQSMSRSNNVDLRVLADSFLTRTREALDMLRDFMSGSISFDSTTGDPSVTINMSARWLGRQDTLQKALNKYVCDGIMFDWLTVTAPTEAAIYSKQLDIDEKEAKSNLYSLGKPATS